MQTSYDPYTVNRKFHSAEQTIWDVDAHCVMNEWIGRRIPEGARYRLSSRNLQVERGGIRSRCMLARYRRIASSA